MTPTLDRRRALVSLAALGATALTASRAVAAPASPEVAINSSEGPGIVVTATGNASAPATTAIGQIVLRAQYAPMPVEGPDEPASSPSDVYQMPAVTQNEVDIIVAVLTDAGVDASMILTSVSDLGYSGGYFGPGSGVIVFQVEGEAIKTLPMLIEQVTIAATELTLMYDPVGVMLLADGCEDLRADAFKSAVEIGRADGALLADALGVELGELTRAVKLMVSYGPSAYSYNASDSCDTLVDLGTALRTYLPPFDISAPNLFTVYATVELTFAFA